MNVSRTTLIGVAVLLFALTAWLFWPTVHGEFLAGDDTEYLRQSERWNGLTWNAVKWAFTSTDSYYHPLVRLSHVLDYQIWGRNAAGHHATGIVVHAINAALVFGFLWTLLGATSLTAGERLAVALWVALVFAIHPLQTESLAWISGRTQQLCTMFGIGCLWAYAAGARRWVVWGLYVVALLCKPMAASFPFVMLAMDYYPLRRHEQLGWGRLLWEKAVWIALAGAAGLATVITKSQIGQLAPLATVPLSQRVFLAFESLTFYSLKLVWPSHLLLVYGMTLSLSLDQWPVLGSVLSVVMITAVAVIERQRVPMLAAAWGTYVMLVLPVSGLMPIGMQAVATRFAYVAMLPLLLLAGGAGVWMWRRSTTVARLALTALLAGQLCAFGVRTRSLIPVWRNDETKWKTELADSPDSAEANRELAMLLLDQGRAGEALKYAQRAVEIEPQVWQAHMTLGSVLGRLGQPQEALAQHEQALRMNPDFAQAHYNCGVALMELGKVPEAVEQYEQALRLKPDYAEAHYGLGAAFVKLGRPEDAIRHCEEALQINPGDGAAHVNLGNALLAQGKPDDAIQHYEKALWINPDDTKAHVNLGNALLAQGKAGDATRHYEEALRINPNDAEEHYNLGLALAQAGRVQEAMEQWEQTLRIKPDETAAHYNLGLALEKLGRTPQAIEHYQQALKLQPDFAQARNALARLQAGR
jgi:tetratricopeptide (TPR) repeat protein